MKNGIFWFLALSTAIVTQLQLSAAETEEDLPSYICIKNYPGSPKDLKKNPDWKETTHPGQAKAGSREFENKKTGEKVRYDKGKPEKSGHGAHDHYHRLKPRPGSPGEYDHVDKNGNPVPRGHDDSHLYPPEGTQWS